MKTTRRARLQPSGFRNRIPPSELFGSHCFWMLGLWLGLAAMAAHAQPLGPVVTIPIEKVREHYNVPSEDGNGKACGVKLYGEWPVYRNYTNRSSYRIFTPGLQSTAAPQNVAPPGGRFRFYCWFNGISTPFNDSPCPSTIGEDLPDWYVEVQRRGPQASFTARFHPPEPGQYEFTSTSTDPEGELLLESWDFGDGASGGGTSPIHRYTQPGIFTARLTVTDTDALTNQTSRSVTVPAPEPGVSIRLLSKHTGNRIELGEEFGVRVTVRAGADGVGALSDLAFTGPPLGIPGLFTLVNAPAATPIGTLQPGGEREFDWTLRADLAGEFALTASAVTGKDAIGRTVSGTGAAARGEVTSLIVGITQIPPRVVLGGDNNSDGETNALDRLVELVVGITNVTQQDVTDVHAMIVDDPIQLTSKAQDLNIWLTPVTVPPGDFGTIRPGPANAVLRTNVYEATDRTYAEASILLQGKVGDAGVQARGEGIVNIGGETLLEARFDVQDHPYKSGQPVRVFGSLKNVSKFISSTGEVLDEGKALGVVVYTKTEGNGGGGFLYPADAGGRTPTGPQAFTVAPDEELDVEAILPTSESPDVTTLKVQYDVAVWILDGEGDPERAKPTEYEVVEKDGWSASHTVNLLGVAPIKDPWLACPLDLSVGGYLSCRFVEGLNGAYRGLADAAALAGSGLVGIPGWRVQLQAWKLWMLEQTLEGLRGDEDARRRLATEIMLDLQAMKTVGVTGLKGVAITADSVLRAMDQSIRTNTALYQAGNYKQIAGNLAEVTGENVDMAFEALVAARTMRTALLATDGVENVASAALRNSLQRQTDELAGLVADARVRGVDLPTSGLLKAGMDVTDLPSVWRDAYGARKQDIQNLLQVARDEGVTIAFRSRSTRSGDLLDAGLAYNKPGGVSIKTVNDLDRLYLGYEDDWEGICMLVEPPVPWKPPGAERDALVNAYLDRFGQLTSPSDFSKDLRASVRERLETRLDEWPKQLEKFSGYVDNGIDVDFHLERNGLPERLRPNSKLSRDALVTPGEIPSRDGIPRRRTFRLQMEGPPPNGTGVFRDITGDIDLLAILGPDGKPLTDVAKRLRIYDQLQRLIGIQHGESFTYSGGEQLRESFLRCCVEGLPGAETLLAAGPDARLRATYFSDKKSVFSTGPNGELGPIVAEDFAFLPGTTSELASDLRPSGGLQLPSLSSLIDQSSGTSLVYSPADLKRLVDALKLAAKPDQFFRSNAVPVRPDGAGGAQTYGAAGGPAGPGPSAAVRNPRGGARRRAGDPPAKVALAEAIQDLATAGHPLQPPTPPPGAAGGQWQPVDAATLLVGTNGTVLPIAPMTYIADDVPAGATVLATLTLSELGMDPLSPFFAVGDRVVIDPGGPDEEFATLVSVHPFTVSHPVATAKPIGTQILFLSGIADGPAVPGALPALGDLLVWLRADAGLELDGTNVVSWTDQSRHGFVFRPPTAAARPAWVANSTSGIPAVRFSGSANPTVVGNLERTLTHATIFTLGRYLDTGGGTRFIYAFGTRDFSGLQMTLGRRNSDGAYHYDGAAQRIADNTIPGTGLRVFSQVFGEGGDDRHQLAVNLQTVLDTRTTTGRAYSAIATNVVLGRYPGSGVFGGDLVEWIIYDRALDASERLQVEEYLRQRAGLAPFFAPGSLDLNRWRETHFDVSAAPTGTWTLDMANRSLGVAQVADPSLTLSPFVVAGQTIRARLSAGTNDGFMGFAFGYQGPGQFYLLDWRQAASTHPEFGAAPRGLRLRAIHIPDGGTPTGVDLWSSPDPECTTLLRTHDVPWVAGREYELVLEHSPGRIDLSLFDGATEVIRWELEDATQPPGQFGFYANGVAGARFGQVTLPGVAPLITGIATNPLGQVTVDWLGGTHPYLVETTSDLGAGTWTEAAPATPNQALTLTPTSDQTFFRIRSAGVAP